METQEFEDHELVYDAIVKGVIGKLYVSTQDRTKFYLDLEKAVLKVTEDLTTEKRHSQYVMTGSLCLTQKSDFSLPEKWRGHIQRKKSTACLLKCIL